MASQKVHDRSNCSEDKILIKDKILMKSELTIIVDGGDGRRVGVRPADCQPVTRIRPAIYLVAEMSRRSWQVCGKFLQVQLPATVNVRANLGPVVKPQRQKYFSFL